LTFALGLLITIGTLIYIVYTASGLALLPVALIKSAPSISAPSLALDTATQLEQNRERQHQLQGRNEGRQNGLDSRDRRELEALIREERTLVRRERLAAEARGEGKSVFVRAWHKIEAVFRPIKLLGGLTLMVLSLLIFTSMLITGIDKAKYSVCKAKCGYILGHTNIFQPINWIFVVSAQVFPVDYILFLLLIVFLFCASVVGLATIGIRFLWVVIFQIRKGRTSPQALLMTTVLLTLMVLAINYSVAMMIAPQYAIYGPQTYCDRPPRHPGDQPDCSDYRADIKPCSELAENPAAQYVCTPSVASTFINRMTANFPFFGVVDFWAQFAFLGTSISSLFSPSISLLATFEFLAPNVLPLARGLPTGFHHHSVPNPKAGHGRLGCGSRGRRGGRPLGEHGETVQRYLAGYHGPLQEALGAIRSN
jgi:LMBR1 domain-containing protein 1